MRDWLTFSKLKGSIYCSPCLFFGNMYFAIRYVLPSGTQVERFLSFIPMTSHVTASMLDIVMIKLEEFGIDIQDCRG